MDTKRESKNELISKIFKIIIALSISITSYCLGGYWFGWELSLVIFLAMAGDNLEKRWFD